MITKPMLAGKVTDFFKIKFPVLATPKIDGIRCLRIGGKSLSRSFKEIPNKWIQEQMAALPDGLDGELVVGKNFQETSSGVMSREGKPNFTYLVFDFFGCKVDYTKEKYTVRINILYSLLLPSFCTKLIPEEILTLVELGLYEQEQLELGYEGICIRQPDSLYKCGRSTEKEGYLLKIKRFQDSEAQIVEFEPQYENCNKLETDELGYAKRSTHQDEMYTKSTLGAFQVKEIGDTPWKGKVFSIGTGVGLTHRLRKEIWENKESYLGGIITYKYQRIGSKDLPRCPIFKGFRELGDI